MNGLKTCQKCKAQFRGVGLFCHLHHPPYTYLHSRPAAVLYPDDITELTERMKDSYRSYVWFPELAKEMRRIIEGIMQENSSPKDDK